MNRYRITYPRCEKTITLCRKANTAADAIEAVCRQYGWGFRLRMISAEDIGAEWAVCSADTNGGINYNIRILAVKEDNNG